MKKVYFILILVLANITVYCQVSEKPFSKEKDKADEEYARLMNRCPLDDSAVYERIKTINAELDIEKKAEMIYYMGNIDNKLLVPYLIGFLKSDTAQTILINSINALAGMSATEAIPEMLAVKKMLTEENKLKLAGCLSQMGDYEGSYKIAQELDKSKLNEQTLRLFLLQIMANIASPAAIDTIRNYLNCGDKVIESYACFHLVQLGYSDEVFPKLSLLAEDDDHRIREASIHTLAYIGDEKSLEIIRKHLYDENNVVRNRAQSILKRFTK